VDHGKKLQQVRGSMKVSAKYNARSCGTGVPRASSNRSLRQIQDEMLKIMKNWALRRYSTTAKVRPGEDRNRQTCAHTNTLNFMLTLFNDCHKG